MRMRLATAAVVATLAVLVLGSPASAITNGTSDGTNHPYVGLMQTHDANGVPLQVCTGALLSPTVFLTAAHCVAEPHAAHAEIWFDNPIQFDIDYLIALFFNPNFSGSCNESPLFDGYPCKGVSGGTPQAHPDFCFECAPGLPNRVSHDYAVLKLDHPVSASRYASLPARGLLDTLANKTASDFVGYGVQTQVKVPGKFLAPPPPGHRWVGAGERMFADGQLVSGNFAHSDEFARFSMNRGGFCFGDSGGPDLLAGTDTVIGVNSYVTNFNCSGVGYSSRVDTPEALSWIEGFMR